MNNYFITGTDTNVGKTVISALLVKLLNAHYWKPIQTGAIENQNDSDLVQKLIPEASILPSSYIFQTPLSPHEAARKENKEIKYDSLISPPLRPLIIEGAGGICVPINDNYLILDIIKKFQFPVILVTRGTLGTINHTLLTISLLRLHEIPIYGIIFNGELNIENQKTIEKWGEVKTLCHVPHFREFTSQVFLQWINENFTRLYHEFSTER